MSDAIPSPSRAQRLREVAAFFLRLGFTAFGGPAAHIALMHAEAVERRKWLDDARFLDLWGAANMIPGPTSTEMAIFLGWERAGWAGLLLGGLCFILPAMLITLALAWAYVRFGSSPQVGWLLYGVKPVIIAIILQALWNLGRRALKGIATALVAGAVLGLYLLGVNVLVLLLGGALILLLREVFRHRKPATPLATLLPLAGWSLPAGAAEAAAATAFSLPVLFLTFLKIGAVLYGSGYVLLAFLRADLVVRLGWLSEQQLLDGIAIGQVTPGPVFTSATFIGYVLGGLPGALLATLGIFLPSFLFVPLVRPVLNSLRRSRWSGAFLDGVIAASLGLMAGVTGQLALGSLVDPFTILLAILGVVVLFRTKMNPTWLILGGAVLGIVVKLIR